MTRWTCLSHQGRDGSGASVLDPVEPKVKPGRARGPGSGNRRGDADVLAVEVPDQREDRVGDAVQELHADLERFVALAGLAPDDPAVHLQELFGPLEVDDDVDDRADEEILFTADPGPGQGNVISVGVDSALREALRRVGRSRG
ncbi:MAG: hypothetical protein MZV64_11095 [Ignavibacteriales bacterium]|nr:hypothetical protein [Ignavibacteriales bacterium]